MVVLEKEKKKSWRIQTKGSAPKHGERPAKKRKKKNEKTERNTKPCRGNRYLGVMERKAKKKLTMKKVAHP